MQQLYERLQHTREWYATRLERLWRWAHAELNEEQREHYFSIVANGTADIQEPPSYARQLNVLRHRVEAAERERDRLRALLDQKTSG